MNESGDFELKKLFIPLTNKKVYWIILIVGLIVFCNMLSNKFVWDDRAFIEFNPDLLKIDIPYLLGANSFNNIDAGHYRFLPALYFAIFQMIFKNNTFVYHVFQLAFHIINAFLLYYFFNHFLKKGIALFLALIFLIHPMQVESVSYIASIDSILFFLMGTVALVLNLSEDISKKHIAIIFSLMFVALLAKETSALFLMLLVLYRFLFHKKKRILFLVLAILTVVPYLYIRLIYANIWFSSIALAPIARLGFFERIVNVPGVVFYYIKTFLWPSKLAIEQFWIVEKLDFNTFYFPLFVISIFIIALAYLGRKLFTTDRKKFKQFIFFSIWLITGTGLYSHLFHLDMTVSDRWFYYPIVGLLGIIGLTLQTNSKFILKNRSMVILTGITIMTLLSVRTIARNLDWRDPITLYTHDSRVFPNFDLENNLGGELNLNGRPSEAFIHFENSVRLFPHETNLFNLGAAYQQKGDLKNAEKYYFEALKSKSYGQVPHPHLHQNLTYEKLSALLLIHEPKKCLAITKMGLSDYHDDAQLWYTQTLCYYKEANLKQSLISAKKAYELLPGNAFTKQVYEVLSQGKKLKIN